MLVHADTAPQRIVSLKPNLTELLFALGVGDRVVGVTRFCDVPDAAKQLPKIADYVTANVEAIVALHPDLVVASEENSARAPIEQLRAFGIPVALYDTAHVRTLLASILELGARVGANGVAEKLHDTLVRTLTMPTFLSPAFRASSVHTRSSALLIVGHYPLIAAGPKSFLGELLVAAGGTNVIATQNPDYPQISMERVLALHPDLVIDVAGSMGERELSWPSGVVARAVAVDALRAGPRLDVGVHALRDALYRGRMEYNSVSRFFEGAAELAQNGTHK